MRELPPGTLAAVVTKLEMRERPRPAGCSSSSQLRLERWNSPDHARYLALFRRVGEPWLWYSRLLLDDPALVAIIGDPLVEVHAAVDAVGGDVGMLELNFRTPGETEVSYFGLAPEWTGQGHGRWLMAQALNLAWRRDTRRVWLHTCTLDHPSALGFYRAQGFVPYARAIERFPDPRVAGLLPPGAAPQIPLLTRL